MGAGDGAKVGLTVVGAAVGSPGNTVGTGIGRTVGAEIGSVVGAEVGTAVGTGLGRGIGTELGADVAAKLGSFVGAETGSAVGAGTGSAVGVGTGSDVGTGSGNAVGDAVVGCGVGRGENSSSHTHSRLAEQSFACQSPCASWYAQPSLGSIPFQFAYELAQPYSHSHELFELVYPCLLYTSPSPRDS